MVAWAPAVGAGIAAMGLLGNNGGGGDALRQQAIDEFTRLEGRAPTAQELQVQIQKYVDAGQITPEMAATVDLGPSSYEDIHVDPQGRQAQADALRQLSEITEGGGLTAIDRSKINAIEGDIDTRNRGAQEAITQNAAERGVGGSGLELASRLSAQQAAATTGASRATDVAASAQERALAAIAAKANIGGNLQSQDFGQAAKVADARDAINRFNASNRQSVINSNVDRSNTAQTVNVQNAQDIANKNTAAENANRTRNADVKQQVFNNAATIASGKAGVDMSAADAQDEERKRKEAYNAALIGAGGTMMTAKP